MKNTVVKDKEKIDIVITWVDGNDQEWQKEKNKYLGIKGDCSKNRFRDWMNLQYIFRGIEEYMPWVNNVFLVTCGHLPKWLNVNSEKLKVVRHDEFIPKEYLPTFNSNVIEMNLYRIKELSEKFILFNDDIFILKPLSSKDFFKDGLPRDYYIEYVKKNYSQRHKIMRKNNFTIINKYFNKKEFIRNNISKVFNIRYGIKNLKTLHTLKEHEFCDLFSEHLSQSFLKSTFDKVWSLEFEMLDRACYNKFRAETDLGQGLIRYWQIFEGKFSPSRSMGKYFFISENNEKIMYSIRHRKYKLICINDAIKDIDFEKSKDEINGALQEILNKKSKFEL